jgi:hypothetical protein
LDRQIYFFSSFLEFAFVGFFKTICTRCNINKKNIAHYAGHGSWKYADALHHSLFQYLVAATLHDCQNAIFVTSKCRILAKDSASCTVRAWILGLEEKCCNAARSSVSSNHLLLSSWLRFHLWAWLARHILIYFVDTVYKLTRVCR